MPGATPPETYQRARQRLLVLLGVCAVALLPWIGYLIVDLPNEHASRQWKITWVGFDAALVACFAAATWLGWRRSRAVQPMLIVTATLLLCDAWFDITLSWNDRDWWVSLAMAGGVEAPLAVLLALRARRLAIAFRQPPPSTDTAEADLIKEV
jgi:hypothetical protein